MSVPILIGHRGSPTAKPENTIASFKSALDNGLNSIELDVRAAVDGIVVMHDSSLNRTTKCNGYLRNMTIAEIKTCKSHEESVPTLQEALQYLVDKCLKIFVEIKDTIPDIEEQVLEVVASGIENYDPIVVTSFYPDILARIKELQPEIETGLIFQSAARWKRILAVAESIEADYLLGGRPWLRKPYFIEAAKDRQFKVITWGVNRVGLAKKAQTLEMDGIMTDLPQIFHGIDADPKILEKLVDDGYIREYNGASQHGDVLGSTDELSL